MAANQFPCLTCGEQAQVEVSHADGSFTFYCIPHAIGAFEVGSAVFAVEAPDPVPVPAPLYDSQTGAPLTPVESTPVDVLAPAPTDPLTATPSI